MNKLLILVFILSGIACFAQPGGHRKKDHLKYLSADSVFIKLQQLKDSFAVATPQQDTDQVNENMSRNMNGILQLQKDIRAKQKRAAIVRISIGVILFLVLIVGLRRKRK